MSTGVHEDVAVDADDLVSSSLRKPFITESTMISVATPSMMPRTEKKAITETQPPRRRARR